MNRLSKTTTTLLNVRCLTENTLSHLFEDIKIELKLPSTFPSGVKIIDHLTAMGLASRIPIKVASATKPSNRFYLFGVRESEDFNIDPLELLQSYQQSGVICYFSALSHLGLTTQIAAHHHIAKLIPYQTKTNIERPEISSELNNTKNNKIERSKIGTIIFSFQEIPYYSTKRLRKSAPGIKTRILSPLSKIRITTKEQTLLDTLQYPYHCGGPETVFEAWERQIRNLDEKLITDYLNKIQIAPLTRRVGAILNLYNHNPTSHLSAYLKKSKERFAARAELNTISLLRGIAYSRIDTYWNVAVP